jgi:hypothetical protein
VASSGKFFIGSEKRQLRGWLQLKPKDLRDGTEIAAKTDEPAVVRSS